MNMLFAFLNVIVMENFLLTTTCWKWL